MWQNVGGLVWCAGLFINAVMTRKYGRAAKRHAEENDNQHGEMLAAVRGMERRLGLIEEKHSRLVEITIPAWVQRIEDRLEELRRRG